MTKPARTILFGFIATSALLLCGFLIRPQGLAANDGLSYYGDFKTTIVPYSLGFIVGAYVYLEAAKSVDARETAGRFLVFAMRAIAIMFIGLLVTPSSLVNPIHTVIGTVLFSLQLVVSGWLFMRYRLDWKLGTLLAVELASGVAAFYYLERPGGFLLQVQIVFQLAFGALLIRVLNTGQSGTAVVK